MPRNVAQLLEGLPTMHEALGSAPAPGGSECGDAFLEFRHPGNETEGSRTQGHSPLLASLRPAWVTRDPDSMYVNK